jgi:small nuclear ribonucleoprotein
MSTAPTSVLERIVQQRVVILLKDGRKLSGRLLGMDEHLNMVLDETEETGPNPSRRLGRVVLRGSNVITLQADGGPTAPRAS